MSIIQRIKQSEPIQFTDSSSGADSVLWDFGDGDTSTERNPIHNYSSNGTFVVTLTAYNQFGEDSTTQTVVVSGIGVDYYEVEVEESEEEVVEEQIVEETTEEDSLSYSQDVQTFNLDVPSMPELTLDKDDDDKDMDYGYEGDFSLDASSTSSDDTEDTTTQQTTEEQQGRKVELVFQPFSPDGMSMMGMDIKDLSLVEGELERLQIGTSILITGMESNKAHSREVSFIINDEKGNKGISIDVSIEAQDNFYRIEAEV